jgi:excisionase family DNA binding protein
MSSNVLTIEELADYLKLSPETVLLQATQGRLPGRKIADNWRFLKDAIARGASEAINDWLRAQDSWTIFLQQTSAFADDESVEEP